MVYLMKIKISLHDIYNDVNFNDMKIDVKHVQKILNEKKRHIFNSYCYI